MGFSGVPLSCIILELEGLSESEEIFGDGKKI